MTMTEHLQAMGSPWTGLATVAGFWLTAWLIGRLAGRLLKIRNSECGMRSETRGEDEHGSGGGQARAIADDPASSIQHPPPPEPRNLKPETSFLQLLLGANLLSLTTLLAGMAGLLTATTARGTLLCGSVGGTTLLICEFRTAWRADRWRGIHPAWTWMLFAGLLLLGPALCLPIGWDEQVYQITVPMRWLNDGFPSCQPDLPYSAFPGAGTMPVWLTLAAGGIYAPRLLILSQWLLLCLGLARMQPEAKDLKWQTAILAAVFALSPALLMVTGEVYMELFILLNCVGFLLTLKTTEVRTSPPWQAGIHVGAILATKLTGALLLPALIVAWCWREKSCRSGFPTPPEDADRTVDTCSVQCQADNWHSQGASSPGLSTFGIRHSTFNIRPLILIALAALAFLLPFYLRPWLLTGNPFHPFFAGGFGNGAGELASSAYHHAIGGIKFGVSGIAGLLWNPVLIAGSTRVFDGCFGWSYLVVLALAGLAAWRNPNARKYVVMAGLVYAGWSLTARQARFLLPGFLFLLPAAAMGLSLLPRTWRHAVLAVLAACALVSIPRPWLTHCQISWRAALGRIPHVDLLYTTTGPGYLPTLDTLAAQTPTDAKVMLLFEHRTLYLPRRTVIATPFFQGRYFTPPESIHSADEMMTVMQDAGITHVLVGLSPNDPDRLPEYLDRCGNLTKSLAQLAAARKIMPVCQFEDYALYSVAGALPAPSP